MATAVHVVAGGLTISMSVIMGLPAVLAAAWIAIRPTRTPFADYLALRWTSWSNFFVGAIALALLVGGWDMVSRVGMRALAPPARRCRQPRPHSAFSAQRGET